MAVKANSKRVLIETSTIKKAMTGTAAKQQKETGTTTTTNTTKIKTVTIAIPTS